MGESMKNRWTHWTLGTLGSGTSRGRLVGLTDSTHFHSYGQFQTENKKAQASRGKSLGPAKSSI
jgi:hypothetical protein